MMETEAAELLEGDAFVAVGRITAGAEPEAAARALADLMHHLYWKRKDIDHMVTVAQAGIGACLALAGASDGTDPERAARLRGTAKAICYDLGSFSWPGWDEPGIALSPLHLAIGLEAAKANLRLTGELGRGDLPTARAHWLLGAQQMAAGEYEAAERSFSRSVGPAATAGEALEARMGEGYRHLAAALAGKAGAAAALDEAIAELAAAPEGKGLADQLRTARRVYPPLL